MARGFYLTFSKTFGENSPFSIIYDRRSVQMCQKVSSASWQPAEIYYIILVWGDIDNEHSIRIDGGVYFMSCRLSFEPTRGWVVIVCMRLGIATSKLWETNTPLPPFCSWLSWVCLYGTEEKPGCSWQRDGGHHSGDVEFHGFQTNLCSQNLGKPWNFERKAAVGAEVST